MQGARRRRVTDSLHLGRSALGVGGCLLFAVLAVARSAWGRRRSRVAAAEQPPPLSAKAWYLVDARDGTRLAGQDAGTTAAIASTTKLMTAYVALDELPLPERLVAPPYDPLPGESLLGLEAGERISVRDLLYGLLLPSGNDAAVALADGAAGSVPAFVGEMNRAAGRLGLRDTSYANPIGLDEPGNYSTPRDLATLTMRLRRERLFRRIFDTPRTTLQTGAHPRTIVNHNDLVLTVPWIDGVKTGYTLDAGYVLIGSGTRKGVTLLSVVLGAPSEAAREQDTLSLLRLWLLALRAPDPGEERGDAGGAGGARPRRDAAPGRRPIRCGCPPGAASPFGWRSTLRMRFRGRSRAAAGWGPASSPWTARWSGASPLLSKRPALAPAGSSLASRVDDAVPGPRAVAWAATGAAAVAIVIGIALALTRRRGRGQPGQGAPQ